MQWQARVEIPGTSVHGSGFLVTDRHVLTCAHVVAGSGTVSVTLRNATEPITATVLRSGRWWTKRSEEADVAVLELSEPVDVEPARFAPYTAVELYAGQDLNAHGYPRHFSVDGVNCRFHARPHREIRANVQIDAVDDFTVWLEEGFSGAAAYHLGTGQVVGMVKSAGHDPRVGVIVPIAELVRHCPALAEVIALGSLSPKVYTELREAVTAVKLRPIEVSRLHSAMRSAIPSMPTHLGTLLAVVEAVVVETVLVDDDQMHRHLRTLLDHLDTRPLRKWSRRHLPAGRSAPSPIETRRDGAVVVRLEPSADSGHEAYDLTVWTVTSLDGELTEPVVDERGVDRGRWQERVEAAVEQGLTRMPASVEVVMVEFVLPREFLGEAVDEWTDRTDDDTPLGVSRAVAVRDLDWFTHPNPAALGRRARTLRDTGKSLSEVLRWKDCGEAPPVRTTNFKGWLRMGEGTLALALAGEWTATQYVSAAVASGPPVMLWRRHACSADEHRHGDSCTGRWFCGEMADQLHGVTIDAVAERVRDLRARALASAEQDDRHCGSGLTLLLDDARRRPAPLSFAE
ncbi:trypsin-like peptidase domain-containing protein [Actinoplanes sp. LDG1-06]|uniref:Trypsin-like peptidase domain-containing protein n=1 Tax=Paractinoplanes ovalisporus TaxID=2810368 RepID=A0ABS2ALY9_9ACTN|nr:trypsin-like peptidase domain-containing protein [Actinoplanes ovalisporus]MBM2620830.1 trypsin-like peptidase domain-containing protein [Actinoplanes ovalisporus]